MAFSRTFAATGDFNACQDAEAFLQRLGFSVGRMQTHEPRGILFGSYDIQKWRNLSPHDRAVLHGLMTGDMRRGPVSISIFTDIPAAARNVIASVSGLLEEAA